MTAATFRDWDKIQLNMKPAKPRKEVVPWAPDELIPWIFSMLAISGTQRLSGKAVFVPSSARLNSRLLNKDAKFWNEYILIGQQSK
jgi:hypothetical protein